MTEPSTAMPPIIVIGMHRSGTTMLTEFMRDMGVFMGSVRERNGESVFHLRENSWLLEQCGARWDYPDRIEMLLKNERLMDLFAAYLRERQRSARAATVFHGAGRVFGLMGRAERGLWGWKDPRNSLTLPLWLRLYPDAKIVHVIRHGVDVAHSLQKRYGQIIDGFDSQLKRSPTLFRLRPRRGVHLSDMNDLNFGLNLWSHYESACLNHVVELGKRAHSVRYEEFLEDPKHICRSLSDFVGFDMSGPSFEKATSKLRADRGFAYLSNPEASEFAAKQANVLAGFGYGPDGWLEPKTA